MIEGKNPPIGGSSVSKSHDLDRVKKALEFLLENEKRKFEMLESQPVIRTLYHHTHERKHLIAGRIQGILDSIIVVNKAILGDSKLIDYRIGKSI